MNLLIDNRTEELLSAELEEAIQKAYKKVESVDFANGFYRHDIGARALAAKK